MEMARFMRRPGIFYVGWMVPLILISCDQKEPPEVVIRPVRTMLVKEPAPQVERSFSGLVDSAEGTGIAFEVAGRVIEVIAKEGIRYEKDAVLAKLDATEYENQLRGAEARLTEARQALRRAQQLFETGNTSKSQLESAIAAEKAAQSSYNTARKQVDDTVLTMPYPGVIGAISIEPQMVIGAGQSTMTIQGEGGMEFDAGVPAEVIDHISLGMKARIKLGGLPEESFPATIESITPQASQNTTYPVTLRFDQTDQRLREGLDGEAILSLPNPNGSVIEVPAVAVATFPGKDRFVWIVAPREGSEEIGVVSRRIVKTGNLRKEGGIEILEGLDPGDRIVTAGVHRIEEGQEVSLIASR